MSLCPNGAKDDSSESLDKYDFPLAYVQRKNQTSYLRSLLIQVTLEVSDLATDIVFLVTNLAPVHEDLFYWSLGVIVLALLVRVISALGMRPLVDSSSGRKRLYYWAGFVANIVETNLGVYLMKKSFNMKDKNGLKNPYKAPWERDSKAERDQVSVFARNDIRAGRAEMLNIVSVTIFRICPSCSFSLSI